MMAHLACEKGGLARGGVCDFYGYGAGRDRWTFYVSFMATEKIMTAKLLAA
jgi:hypothetical protein